MTLEELYKEIGGDFDQAKKILPLEKLIDKHIKKLPDNDIFPRLFNAGKAIDGNEIFESAHAIKGVCSNLGLNNFAGIASDLCEEFRPGNNRSLSDEQVKEKIDGFEALFENAKKVIKEYSEGN